MRVNNNLNKPYLTTVLCIVPVHCNLNIDDNIQKK